MLKVKHVRTADVVVAGWRPYKNAAPDGSPMLGALLLGLYDEEGTLHNVGAAGAFSRENRIALAKELAALEIGPDDDHPWKWGLPRAKGCLACNRAGRARRIWDSIRYDRSWWLR